MTGNIERDAASTAIRTLVGDGAYAEAWSRLRSRLSAGEDLAAGYRLAVNVLRAGGRAGWHAPVYRQARLAVLCAYEPAELSATLRTAALTHGIDAEVYTAPYGQIEQELLGDAARLREFAPSHVLLAADTETLAWPELSDDADALVEGELARFTGLWTRIREDHRARVIQHGFVVPDASPLGHLAARMPGSRVSAVRELNRRLAAAAGDSVLFVDADRLAARLGTARWRDPRLWHAARQPMGAEALAWLARDTVASMAGDLGLGVRCLVLDLDNTLWGGVIGEDGLDGIAIGEGPSGEAYAAFQDYLLELRRRGIVLAVASKNDPATARLPFEQHPGMRMKLEDFAVFVADWRRKPEQLSEIAATLGLGLASLAFADDNPAECAEVSAALPELTTVWLDVEPSELLRRLAASDRFEIPAVSEADSARQRSYAARAEAAELRTSSATLEDFWRSLDMRARVRAPAPATLDRIAQLTQKTNQFNLTLQRRTREAIEGLLARDGAIVRTLELDDRFAAHGLVGLGIVVPSAEDPETALLDTLLLSCRVIGRTAEVHLLAALAQAARDGGYARLQGRYVPGPRNALVADLYPKLGFTARDGEEHVWDYDLLASAPLQSPYIEEQP